jgi:DNA primase
MPKSTQKKFIKVENYIQGTDQLQYNCKYLIITSSLKDLMAFNKLGISNIEAIAPDSENTMIGERAIGELKLKYSNIIVLFDNDEPGVKAAERYKEKYGFSYILLPMEKDLSDSVKEHGIDKVREVLFPLLKQAL